MPNLVLLRHGESQWNLENRFTGWVDIPLSQKGEQEAHQAGEKLKGYKFDKGYTSVLKRAIDTMNIVLKIIGQEKLPIERDKALNERHYGALQGLNKEETAKKFGSDQVKLWRRSYDVPPPKDVTDLNPDGISESLKDTAARTLPVLRSKNYPRHQGWQRCSRRGARQQSAIDRDEARQPDARASDRVEYPDRCSVTLRV